MKQARYTYRFYPTDSQRVNLAKTFGCARFVYNWALRLRSDAYHDKKKSLRFPDTARMMTQLKKENEYSWLNEVSGVPLQQSLRHLEKAYQRFFRGQAKFPRFKSKRHDQSVSYMSNSFRIKDGAVYLAKQKEPLDIVWSRKLPPEPSSITIKRDAAGRYFISFVVKLEPVKLTPRNKAVGIDLGLTHALIMSDGLKVGNPRYYADALKKLRREQRKLSRKVKGSSNWHKQRIKVARIHAKIKDMRHDWSHKLTTKLVRRYDTICLEILRVQNMMKNGKLARAIGDVSWYKITSMLEYKSDWYGCDLIRIDQWYPSSKRCSACGYLSGSMPLSVREWICPECGVVHDRDVNAACNILAAGTAVSASGLSVNPVTSPDV